MKVKVSCIHCKQAFRRKVHGYDRFSLNRQIENQGLCDILDIDNNTIAKKETEYLCGDCFRCIRNIVNTKAKLEKLESDWSKRGSVCFLKRKTPPSTPSQKSSKKRFRQDTGVCKNATKDADLCDAGGDSATATQILDDASPSKKKKSAAENGSSSKKSGKAKEKIPLLTKESFSNESLTPSGKPWNMKIASWNINGIRAWVEKDGHTYLTSEDPDILCVQETKCNADQVPEECKIEGYHTYFAAADEPGYSGTGILSKIKPLDVTFGMGIAKHDKEGRVITAEYQKFYLVTSYIPNSGRGLPRLPYRTEEWDVDFRAYLQELDAKKPVILCGDLNVAHEELDLANPKGNKKTAGFTIQERESFGTLLEEGNFIDSFRYLYPEQEKAWTFWTYMANARAKNIGWRLDYFVMSERLKTHLCDSVIRSHVMGSDHCPIAVLLNI